MNTGEIARKMESDYKRILVTSALPYANGPLHLGHLAGAYLPADIYVRYQRLKKRDIIYICGSDEHGVPITIAAERKKVSPQSIVDEFHFRNKEAFAKFGISFDHYGRTSAKIHHETSQEIFLRLHKKGIFKVKTEKQLFDKKANMFLADRYVKGTCPVCSNPDAYGDQCEKCGSTLSPAELINPQSALTGETPEYRETRHWYIPLGDFQERVAKWIETRKHWKANVLGQVKSWLTEGLADRAVTRDLSWGVPVPLEEAKGKVLYVWFDAPIGYISATKEWAALQGRPELWKTYWQDKQTKLVHFIGKDNIVFHCIMFPATLMELGDYVLPDNVPANEFLNLQGNKLSTSRNYAVWLDDYLQKFPVDPLRYYLTFNAPEAKDADFTWQDFQQHNNSELADILGNFVNRTLTFAGKQFNGCIPERGQTDELDNQMLAILQDAPQKIGALLEDYEFRRAIVALVDVGRAANKYFNDQEPWRTAKENKSKCATTINICIHAVQTLALLMQPFMPESAAKIWAMLGLDEKIQDVCWDDAGKCRITPGKPFGPVSILFRKIEDAEVQPEIERLQKISAALLSAPAETKQEEIKKIKYEDFAKLDLRIAKVLEAEKVEKADKLLKLVIEIGAEKRQIIAGVAKFYTPEEMIGKKIVVIANLEPAKIRGLESNGMLLAAEDGQGQFSLLMPEKDLASGAKIR